MSNEYMYDVTTLTKVGSIPLSETTFRELDRISIEKVQKLCLFSNFFCFDALELSPPQIYFSWFTKLSKVQYQSLLSFIPFFSMKGCVCISKVKIPIFDTRMTCDKQF